MEEKRAYLLKAFIVLKPSKHNAIEELTTLLTFFLLISPLTCDAISVNPFGGSIDTSTIFLDIFLLNYCF